MLKSGPDPAHLPETRGYLNEFGPRAFLNGKRATIPTTSQIWAGAASRRSAAPFVQGIRVRDGQRRVCARAAEKDRLPPQTSSARSFNTGQTKVHRLGRCPIFGEPVLLDPRRAPVGRLGQEKGCLLLVFFSPNKPMSRFQLDWRRVLDYSSCDRHRLGIASTTRSPFAVSCGIPIVMLNRSQREARVSDGHLRQVTAGACERKRGIWPSTGRSRHRAYRLAGRRFDWCRHEPLDFPRGPKSPASRRFAILGGDYARTSRRGGAPHFQEKTLAPTRYSSGCYMALRVMDYIPVRGWASLSRKDVAIAGYDDVPIRILEELRT